MRQAAGMVLGAFVDLLLPTRCAACGLPGADLCSGCGALLADPGSVGCARCGHPWAIAVPVCPQCPRHVDQLAFAVEYNGPAPALMHAFKDGRRRAIAQVLADLIVARVARPAGILVPVPSSRAKLRDRGFNPAEQIARRLGRVWGREVCQVLTRPGPHQDQRGASATRRREQVRGAFVAARQEPWPPVVIVDDVMTTGATLSACALALRRAGVRNVQAIVAARVVTR